MATQSTLDIAYAVVSALRNMELPLDYDVEQKMAPEYDLKDLKNRKFVVVPAALEIGPRDKANTDDTAKIDIGILRKVQNDDQIRETVKLAEFVARSFYRKRLAALPCAMCTAVSIDPLYDSELIRQRNQFIGVIRLEFEL